MAHHPFCRRTNERTDARRRRAAEKLVAGAVIVCVLCRPAARDKPAGRKSKQTSGTVRADTALDTGSLCGRRRRRRSQFVTQGAPLSELTSSDGWTAASIHSGARARRRTRKHDSDNKKGLINTPARPPGTPALLPLLLRGEFVVRPCGLRQWRHLSSWSGGGRRRCRVIGASISQISRRPSRATD